MTLSLSVDHSGGPVFPELRGPGPNRIQSFGIARPPGGELDQVGNWDDETPNILENMTPLPGGKARPSKWILRSHESQGRLRGCRLWVWPNLKTDCHVSLDALQQESARGPKVALCHAPGSTWAHPPQARRRWIASDGPDLGGSRQDIGQSVAIIRLFYSGYG